MTPLSFTDFQFLCRSCELCSCIDAETAFSNQYLVVSRRAARILMYPN